MLADSNASDLRASVPSVGHPLDRSAPLREVSTVLRAQWREFGASPATLFHWTVAHDERAWVEEALRGPLDRATKLVRVTAPFERGEAYGFLAGRSLLKSLEATRVPGRSAWVSPAIPGGLRDTDALAFLAVSFTRQLEGTPFRQLVLAVAPERVEDDRRWLAWLHTFVTTVAQHSRNTRILLIDDATHTRYAGLVRTLGRLAMTKPAALGIAERVTRMVEAGRHTATTRGQIHLLTVRALQSAAAGQLAEAERLTHAVEALAAADGMHGAAVPVRFALGNALVERGRRVDAVQSFRAAELAAERAEAAGDPQGLALRVTSRFGVGAALLAAPEGCAPAAKYYAETAPLCRQLGDSRLEFESHRCASLSFERIRAFEPAWDAAVRALGVSDRVSAEHRDALMLVALVDALLRMTESRPLRHYRPGIEHELRKRKLRGSRWA